MKRVRMKSKIKAAVRWWYKNWNAVLCVAIMVAGLFYFGHWIGDFILTYGFMSLLLGAAVFVGSVTVGTGLGIGLCEGVAYLMRLSDRLKKWSETP